MKGILFKPDMIQAIVEGGKTQTRRVIKPQPYNYEHPVLTYKEERIHIEDFPSYARYQVGETVYIKETHYRYGKWMRNGLTKTGRQRWRFKALTNTIYYADNPPTGVKPSSYRQEAWYRRSPLFMPEWAARYFIKILAVRAERVQEITKEDIWDEGVLESEVVGTDRAFESWHRPFQKLWNSINPKCPFESNPWVWVYEFVKETIG